MKFIHNLSGKSLLVINTRVVTRHMGSGITASGSGSWTRDPGSQVMGSGSANFFFCLGGDQGSIAF